jgi:hypothetical protein
MTFRNMVVNDLVQQIGLPLVNFLDSDKSEVLSGKLEKEGVRKLEGPEADEYHLAVQGIELVESMTCCPPSHWEDFVGKLHEPELLRLDAALIHYQVYPDDMLKKTAEWRLDRRGKRSEREPEIRKAIVEKLKISDRVKQLQPQVAKQGSPYQRSAVMRQRIEMRRNAISAPGLSHSASLERKNPFPASQFLQVYGLANCFEIAHQAGDALEEAYVFQGYYHLPDVQSYLREETSAAFRFLAANPNLYKEFCGEALVMQVRSQQFNELRNRRRDFVLRVRDLSQPVECDRPTNFLHPVEYSKTAALAWCIIVDSALLNHRLMQDMRETSTSTGKPCPFPVDGWVEYYLPDPAHEVRTAFNEYVKMRWPVYVFALDPVSQEQNIADALSTRRETQLALAIAFTNGLISANSMTKYARRLEAEYETIALNRTQVGFSHGENVFGWRFYPRFQSPDTKSNLEVLFREQLIGGPNRNQLLRDRRLEPGARECVALVVMPSFVPYLTVDSTSNWFALANPKHKVLDHTQAMRMSKTVRTLQKCEHGITDADCYREGELKRLQTRVEQLANRLPLQTSITPVPILNTLGGFEMFSNGTTDLAPELYGWYGAPGIDRDTVTTLFLVGDHFSPLRSRVVVGNKEIPRENMHMLSRQVMQVTIPAGALTVYDTVGERYYVTAHVATPYGVTRPLDIPLLEKKAEKAAEPPAAKPGFTVGKAKLVINYGVVRTKDVDRFDPVLQGVAPKALEFTWTDATGGPISELARVRLQFKFGDTTLTVPCQCKLKATAQSGGTFVIAEDEVKAIACELLRQIRDRGSLPLTGNPLAAGLTTTAVLITLEQPPGFVTREVKATDQLSVEFKEEGYCPEKAILKCPDRCPKPMDTPTKPKEDEPKK